MGWRPLFSLWCCVTAELKDKLTALLEKPLKDEGSELAEMVISKYKNNITLRLFVYSENGTTIDECTRLSRIVAGLIDGTDYLKSGYSLEVSSPGLDRPLKTSRDFHHRIGETVKIEFVDKKKKMVTAEVVDASDDEVKFKEQNGEFTVTLAEIEKAKIIF